jgi:hypothetical protein
VSLIRDGLPELSALGYQPIAQDRLNSSAFKPYSQHHEFSALLSAAFGAPLWVSVLKL